VVRAPDVILHVRDIAHADSDAQAADVTTILAEIGVTAAADKLIEVWNKLDQLDDERREGLALGQGTDGPIAVSALTGEGVDKLAEAIEARLAHGRSLIDLSLDGADGQGLHWLYEHTEVMARANGDDGRVNVTVRVAPGTVDRVRRRFVGASA
jgi:GTP-binding protein HflX